MSDIQFKIEEKPANCLIVRIRDAGPDEMPFQEFLQALGADVIRQAVEAKLGKPVDCIEFRD